MATNITINDITNGSVVSNEWQGDGVFDKLMSAVNKNIELQFDLGRIKGSDYANVYLGSIQTVLQQSIEYLMREKLLESQVDDVIKGIELKDAQKAEINKGIEIKEEQRKLTYTQRVKEDKEAAMLGLDGVMKKQNQVVDVNHIYTPKYVSA